MDDEAEVEAEPSTTRDLAGGARSWRGRRRQAGAAGVWRQLADERPPRRHLLFHARSRGRELGEPVSNIYW